MPRSSGAINLGDAGDASVVLTTSTAERQQWVITDAGVLDNDNEPLWAIKNQNTNPTSSKVYLSTNADGSVVDLWSALAGANQYWRIACLTPPPAPPFSCGCELVTIELTGDALTAQSSRGGSYVKMDDVLGGSYLYHEGGRYVYQQSGGSNKLYFWAGISDWLVGTDHTSSVAGMKSVDNLDSVCPEGAGTWEFYDGASWISGGISVACPAPPAAPPSPAPPFSCACETIMINVTGDGMNHQWDRPGSYVKMDGVTWDGRAVYQQSGGSNYLYFWAGSNDWLVSGDYKKGNAGLATFDDLANAFCPETGGAWKYWDGTAWMSGGVSAVC